MSRSRLSGAVQLPESSEFGESMHRHVHVDMSIYGLCHLLCHVLSQRPAAMSSSLSQLRNCSWNQSSSFRRHVAQPVCPPFLQPRPPRAPSPFVLFMRFVSGPLGVVLIWFESWTCPICRTKHDITYCKGLNEPENEGRYFVSVSPLIFSFINSIF